MWWCPDFWTLYIVAATGALAPRCRGCARPALRRCVFLGGAGPLPRPPAALGACIGGVALGAQGPVAPPLSRARLARCGTSAVCGPCRAPRPCCLRLRSRSPLRVAAGCGWRGSIRALPCGAARGPARSGGARRPLALGGGCAAARRRGWRGLAPAALRLGLRVLALAPLRRGGVGPGPAPSGLRAAPRASPAALPSRLRSRRGARGSRASPSLAAPARPAPRRFVVLGLSRWCACGRGDGDSAACGRRG